MLLELEHERNENLLVKLHEVCLSRTATGQEQAQERAEARAHVRCSYPLGEGWLDPGSIQFIRHHKRVNQQKRGIKRDKETPMASCAVGENKTCDGPQPAPRHNQQALPKGAPPEQKRSTNNSRPKSVRPGQENRRVGRGPPVEVSLRRHLRIRWLIKDTSPDNECQSNDEEEKNGSRRGCTGRTNIEPSSGPQA